MCYSRYEVTISLDFTFTISISTGRAFRPERTGHQDSTLTKHVKKREQLLKQNITFLL